MKRMYGIEFVIPDGKLPGFYAQAIHKIGDEVQIVDRAKQILIVETIEEQERLTAILAKYHMAGEPLSLIQLPAVLDREPDSDYGFLSLSGTPYLLAELVAFFQFTEPQAATQDKWACLEQLKEYLLLELPAGVTGNTAYDGPVYVVDSSLRDLVEGTARAYKLTMIWLPEIS